MKRVGLAAAIVLAGLVLVSPARTDAPVPGLVAAYSFDDGAGSVARDTSGNGRHGAITGASWAAGRHGGGLDFDGTNDYVGLGALGSFYQGGFTLEAWVRKQTAKKDVAVLGTWAGNASGGPMIWVDHIASRYHVVMNQGFSNYLDTGQGPLVGEWQHLAATFDESTARFYVDGVEVASRPFSATVGLSNVWYVGAYDSSPTGFFDGVVDDVRVYSRALSAAEVQTDMNLPVPSPDVTAPSAPGTLTASGGFGEASLAWGAATDGAGVVRYNLHRSTTSGFAPSAANRVAQPAGTSYADADLAAGTYYYRVTAEDAAGNVGAPGNEASAVVAADTASPTVSITWPASGAALSGLVPVNVDASDNGTIAGVQLRVDGANAGAEDTTAPYAISWDTRGETNGSHTLTAVARDAAGNSTISAPVTVSVSNSGVSPAGLRASWGLDEGAGAVAADASGSNNTANLAGGAGWASGRFGGAVSLDGTNDELDPPALGTFYRTGFTYEAWVLKETTKRDVGVIGSWAAAQGGGAMIWIDHFVGHYRLTLGGDLGNYLDSGQAPVVGQWQHVAATYDGSTARFYLDGVLVASKPFTGSLGSSNTWRIGAYGSPAGGFLDGRVDNVRIYDRALSAAEVAEGMASRVQPEFTPPTVTGRTPAPGSSGVNVGTSATATFSEPLSPSTVTSSSVELRDGTGTVVAANVSYDAPTRVATLTPQGALQFGTTYTATVKGGSAGVKDLAGNALAADVSWSFTTEASPPQILVIGSVGNPFGMYLGEILRNEGLNAFTTVDVAFLTPALLSGFDVVLLGQTPLNAAQVAALTGWVNAGGNLIAMRPDNQLAGLLGLTATGLTRSNAYLRVNTAAAPGTGIVGSTIQYHGTADRYALAGATAVATLYASRGSATTNPAVTLRSIGGSGGQAAAFTFDLARSIVYTRQGNPAWATQERDGVLGIRPNDMFYGAKAGDVQADWVDTARIAIPQADEQQRLLANLITVMVRDKLPLPRFWYLPRGEKAAVVLSGDDHSPGQAPGGTASHFDRYKALSAPGCSVTLWDCVRSTSYIYPDSALTNAQAAAYQADGFEVALHPVVSSCPAGSISQAELGTYYDTQLAAFLAKYTSVVGPVSSRTHCVYWPDWVSNAKVELARGIRLDANYYHYPGTWIGATPGFMNGGGFPMRFADTDGSLIDVYQQNTNITDESTTNFSTSINTLLNNAIGAKGYYGVFETNLHTDDLAPYAPAETVVASAKARGVPLISNRQLLEWVDGRNSSTIRGLSWSAGTFTFTTTVAAGANGLQTMLPTQGPSGTLTAITRAGSPVAYTVQTIKGIQYAMFTAATATYTATYS